MCNGTKIVLLIKSQMFGKIWSHSLVSDSVCGNMKKTRMWKIASENVSVAGNIKQSQQFEFDAASTNIILYSHLFQLHCLFCTSMNQPMVRLFIYLISKYHVDLFSCLVHYLYIVFVIDLIVVLFIISS